MTLQEFSDANTAIALNFISRDVQLAKEIQARLAAFGFLDPPADGKFGPLSTLALREFGKRVGVPSEDVFGKALADVLLTKTVEDVAPLVLGDDLASKLIKYMLLKEYWVARAPGLLNIIYVEGMNEDGTLNSDEPDKFNDVRMVISIEEGRPKLLKKWQATTEPGRVFTITPPKDVRHLGVARIAFGQYKAWRVGTHHGLSGHSVHEALVQVDNIVVCRDLNKDFKRTGDKKFEGVFAINQHSSLNKGAATIGSASAGCLVGQVHAGHLEFMKLVKTDPRFKETMGYTFMTAVIAGDDFVAQVG